MIKLFILWLTADSKMREAAIRVLQGEAHARTYPKKRGDRGFKMVEGGEG
jgi:hypothetical protein